MSSVLYMLCEQKLLRELLLLLVSSCGPHAHSRLQEAGFRCPSVIDCLVDTGLSLLTSMRTSGKDRI